MNTDTLTIKNGHSDHNTPTFPATVTVPGSAVPRLVVRIAGYRRHWRISHRAGQLLTLEAVRGATPDPAPVVHAGDVFLVRLEDPERD